MKAIVFTEYGSPDVLKLQEVEKPTPKDNEVLIKVHATSVTFGDLLVRNLKALTPFKFSMPTPLWLPTRMLFGFSKPKKQILGAELSGTIEAIGKDVTRFKVGDEVFGYPGQDFGANAEYITMSEKGMVAIKPTNVTFEEATTIPYGAMTAMNVLKKANIQAGQKVLINGASGAIGSYAVQFAKSYGAEVTAICGSERHDFVKALGADHVIDYKKEDFTKNGKTYDVILDVPHTTTFGKSKKSLKRGGIYMLASFKTRQLVQMLWTKFFGNKRVICAMSMETQDTLIRVKELTENGTIKTIVDRCFPLEQTADAHRYVESGRKTGHVVVTM